MANLDGSLSHGGKWDVLAGAMLRDDPARFSHIYRVLLHAARLEGIAGDRLPDFLSLASGGELALLGQEELDISTLEAELREQIARRAATSPWSDLETERILLASARVGQHVFAQHVLANCGGRCVFCGLKPATFGAARMLLAGHIKPWKDSTPAEPAHRQRRAADPPRHSTDRCGSGRPARQAVLRAATPAGDVAPATGRPSPRPQVSRLASEQCLRRMKEPTGLKHRMSPRTGTC
jgi:putative restriction endonuclease